MNNSREVLAAIEHLATLKTKEKQAQLKEYMEASPLMVKVLKAAYCPFTTYGVKKIPQRTEDKMSNTFELESVWFDNLLNGLSTRRISGNLALSEIEDFMNHFCEDSQELMRRILIKDMRAGFTAKSVNKAMPGTIFVFECMLAHKYEEKRIKEWPVSVEPKYDGVRALLVKKGSEVSIYSRTGKPLKGLNHIASKFAEVLGPEPCEDMVIDGEVIHKDGFNEIVGAVHRKDEQSEGAIFQVFDILSMEEFEDGKSDDPYPVRVKTVEMMVQEIGHPFYKTPSYLASSNEEIEHFYQTIRDKGGEGVIVKPRDGLYECKRSYNWLKIKDRQTVDIPIIGFEEGTGKNAGRLGALVCDLDGVHVKVGGGLTDLLRDEIWEMREHYVGIMIEVEYHEMTPDGSLRHPRFIKVRADKPVEDGVGV